MTLSDAVRYVIADFNAMSNHLLGYLKAKWIGNCQRNPSDQELPTTTRDSVIGWEHVMDAFGMVPGSAARQAAQDLCVR